MNFKTSTIIMENISISDTILAILALLIVGSGMWLLLNGVSGMEKKK